MSDPDAYPPISDYALLSDCHSSALVSSRGSIDWACFRRFDAGSTFARILDHERGGHLSLRPTGDVSHSERGYLDGTMVLETTMATETGTIVVTDAFAMEPDPYADAESRLVRRVRCVEGEVEVELCVRPRFDYGASRPWLEAHGDTVVGAVGGDDALVIAAGTELQVDLDRFEVGATVTLAEGESLGVVLVAQAAYLFDHTVADPSAVDRMIDDAVDWWRAWSAGTRADGPHAELLERSALVLRSLCCAPTGAIIAAPTTSLPEIPGGSANWDYRFCWVRDSALTLAALGRVGHLDVAERFRDFIRRSSSGHGDELQIMYGIYGERRLPELEADLEGWRGASPVRYGNGAATQVQLDVYGHLLDAAFVWESEHDDIGDDDWRFLRSVVEQAVERRRQPDAGIWEIRGAPREYVHSKVMVWVAVDRGIRLVEEHHLDGVDLQAWCSARDEVRHAVETRGVDLDRGNFVQHFGSTEVDASLLKLPLVGFVDADDPRMLATVDAIQRDLADERGFVRRYRVDDGSGGATVHGGDEGVFLLCTFWLVEVLALQGRVDEAVELFERLVEVGNDVGLFSEEFDVATASMLGNFPQAFTHIGLIRAEERLASLGAWDGR